MFYVNFVFLELLVLLIKIANAKKKFFFFAFIIQELFQRKRDGEGQSDRA